MATLSSTTWDEILAKLREAQPALARGWFAALRPEEIRHGVLEIIAQNAAQVRYLTDHCRLPLAEAAQRILGRLIAVEFRQTSEPSTDHTNRRSSAYLICDDNPAFKLERFVVGSCNQFAHSAACAVIAEPHRAYNPFVICGARGTGKSHLLHAIHTELHARNPSRSSCLLPAASFTSQLIEALEHADIERFRARFRDLDVIAIDDIDQIAGLERSQEEFFHLFNAWRDAERQIILTSERPPSQLTSLEPRLASRLGSGLVVTLEAPCLETRLAILRSRAAADCIAAPAEAIQFIAEQCATNAMLIAALHRLDRLSQQRQVPISMALAKESVEVTTSCVAEAVARRFDVTLDDLQSRDRSKTVATPRHVCMYLARQLTSESLNDIGRFLGGRDQGTVAHGVHAIEQLAAADPSLRSTLDALMREVHNAR